MRTRTGRATMPNGGSLVSNVHIYRAKDQPATRFKVVLDMPSGTRTMWLKNADRCPIRCFKCRKRRWAVNMIVHVYYDGSYYFCRKGKGCKA
jgi:hypothetical protein